MVYYNMEILSVKYITYIFISRAPSGKTTLFQCWNAHNAGHWVSAISIILNGMHFHRFHSMNILTWKFYQPNTSPTSIILSQCFNHVPFQLFSTRVLYLMHMVNLAFKHKLYKLCQTRKKLQELQSHLLTKFGNIRTQCVLQSLSLL